MAAETSIAADSGPSLEDILWRAMDRFGEDPALLDAEEFAARLSEAFDGELPAEEWVERFFAGHEDALHRAPRDMADAVVRATHDRLHVYKFNLAQLEYVIIEDKDKVVIVSDFGQFSLQNSDQLRGALETAVVRPPSGLPARAEKTDREPGAYFVRRTGEVVTVDVKKIGRVLERFLIKQAPAAGIKDPAVRLAPLHPAKAQLAPAHEARILREADPRMRLAVPAPPRLAKAEARAAAAPPAAAETAVFLLMPDGSLARPAMGAATRWQEMVSAWVARAESSPAASPAMQVTSSQRFMVGAGQVVAIFEGGHREMPGSAGERAQVRAEAVSQARTGAAPIRILGDDELAQALAKGAVIVPGLAQESSSRFWVQPERAFAPGRTPEMGAPAQTLVEGAQPLQLGQITGDPWADWALAGGGQIEPGVLMAAARGRRAPGLYRAAVDRDTDAPPPGLAGKLRGMAAQELVLRGSRVIAFRTPDGSVVVQRESGPIRLAALDRPSLSVELKPASAPQPLALRSGAIPAAALDALHMALERTAAMGGYKLPLASLVSAPDAIDVGSMLPLGAGDARRSEVRLAGAPYLFDSGARGQVAQLVLSMPFPNGSEVHVGQDLADALQQYLTVPVVPAGYGSNASGTAFIAGGVGLGAAGGAALGLRSASAADYFKALHGQASQSAQDAMLSFKLPDVQKLLVASPTQSGLPTLLSQAINDSGAWSPGPGAPMPLAIRQFALQGPFEDFSAPPQLLVAGARRPLNPGEDEIVIPLPLWAQMGRGRISATEQIMASPTAPAGYAPPLGAYRLVAPYTMPIDFTGGAPASTDGIVQLAGPTGLDLAPPPPGGRVSARSLGGRHLLALIALDDGGTVVGSQGRFIPGDPDAAQPGPVPGSFSGSTPGTLAAPSSQQLPSIDSGSLPSVTASSGSQQPMAGALSSALQMSDDVNSRTLPARPGTGSDAGSSGVSSASGSSSDFSSSAAAAGRSDAASSMPTLGSGPQQTLVAGSTSSGSSASLPSLGQSGSGTGQAAADAGTTASSASQRLSSGSSGGQYISGLPPGAWSGARRGEPGYMRWSYVNQPGRQQSVGGVDVSGLGRPVYPSLPTSLRFRYVGAPLWWSGTVAGGVVAGSASADGDDAAPATRAMRSGLRAATSAASMWKSIFVASPQWGGGSAEDVIAAGQQPDLTAMSGRLDALSGASLAAGGAVAGAGGGAGANAVYVATNSSGAAGATTAAAAARARADAIEMSIVAAIPAQPPPLESMGSGASVAHARGKGQGHGHQGHDKDDADRTSQSKIEGSVDAIAQRIYHRIRRRIQSDRERFGG